jgi:hypothetical protein
VNDYLADRTPPSWLVPILIGAAFTFVVQALWDAIDPGYGTGACCCGTVSSVVYGFLPAFVAQRRDPSLHAGQGFVVAFIGVGLAMVVWAAIHWGSTDAERIGEFERFVREQMEQAGQQAGTQLTAEERDEAVRMLVEAFPFIPVVTAGVVTVLAGLGGLLTALVFQPRRARHAPEDVQ